MELTFWQKQLILYTKGQYGKIDYDRHLKYFAGLHFEIHIDHITEHHIFKLVSKTYHDLQKRQLVTFNFERFMCDVFRNAKFDGREDVQLKDVIIRLLSEISSCNNLGSLELGEKVDSLEKVLKES